MLGMETKYAGASDGRVGEQLIKANTPFDEVFNLTNRVHQLADRISELENKLVGAVPTGTEASGKVPPPVDGLFGNLGTSALEADRKIYNIHAALDRIERQLP